MTRAQEHCIRFATLATALLPSLALAHPGHGDALSFVAGALHPLSGFDHVVALFAAGLLAGRLGGQLLWLLSASFLGLLVAAGTSDSDGWRFAAGFMLTSAALIAAGVTATRVLASRFTAGARRSPT